MSRIAIYCELVGIDICPRVDNVSREKAAMEDQSFHLLRSE